jgi:hypothetical protein
VGARVVLSSSKFDSLLIIAKEKLRSKKGILSYREKVDTWDKRARKLFFQTMIEILREKYGMDESAAKKYIYVEQFNRFPGVKEKIFGSYLYPDAIMKFDDGQKVAVELDSGWSGSKIKNALAKAGILKLVGDFYKIVVFFFVYPPLDEFKLTEIEQKVLKFYQENLSTWLFLI